MSGTAALFSDIDGTLLGDASSEEDFSAYLKARRSRLMLAYVTSRSMRSTLALVADGRLPIPRFVCTSVGTELRDLDDPSNALGKKYRELAPHDWSTENLVHVGTSVGLTIQPPEEQAAYKVSFYWDGNQQTLAQLCYRITADSHCCRVLASSQRYIDLLPTTYGKGAAVSFLLSELKLDRSECYVAGDTETDLPLFELGCRGILPANALPALTQRVKHPDCYRSNCRYAAGILDGLAHWGA
ncbi:MAG: HAD family hydrolase [Proteobacteria bacterium]|nr:HAD family hydrolase [Pseudomonadota bacterium]